MTGVSAIVLDPMIDGGGEVNVDLDAILDILLLSHKLDGETSRRRYAVP